MRRPTARAITCLLVMLSIACGLWGCARRSGQADPTLTIISSPSGLTVLVDGEIAGKTPLRGLPLSKGEHKLKIAGANPFETTVSADKDHLPVVVFYADSPYPAPRAEPLTVSADTPETTVSLFGQTLAPAPFSFIPASNVRMILTAESSGRLPVLAEVSSSSSPGSELKLRLTEKRSEVPRTVPLSQVKVPELRKEAATASFSIGPTSAWGNIFSVSPDGRRVVLCAGDGMFAAFSHKDGNWSGEPLFAWRRAPMAVQQYGEQRTVLMSRETTLLGWQDSARLVVAVGEADPTDRVSGEGLGIWILDVTGGSPRRAAWIAPEHLGDAAMMPQLTGDGAAVIVQHQHLPATITSFAVADLKTGNTSDVSADIPHSDYAVPGVCFPSPDKWAVAFQRPYKDSGPTESEVFVLDLRTGTEGRVFSCTKGGLAANIVWAPDSGKLAIGYAPPGEKPAVLQRDESYSFLPPQYVVVSDSGQRLGTFRANGKQLASNPCWSADGARFAAAEIVGVEYDDQIGYDCAVTGDILAFQRDGTSVAIPCRDPGKLGDITLTFAPTGELMIAAYAYANGTCTTSVVPAGGSSRLDYGDCAPLGFTQLGLLSLARDGERVELRPPTGDPISLLPDGRSYRNGSCTLRGTNLFLKVTNTGDEGTYYLVIIDLSTLAANQPR